MLNAGRPNGGAEAPYHTYLNLQKCVVVIVNILAMRQLSRLVNQLAFPFKALKEDLMCCAMSVVCGSCELSVLGPMWCLTVACWFVHRVHVLCSRKSSPLFTNWLLACMCVGGLIDTSPLHVLVITSFC